MIGKPCKCGALYFKVYVQKLEGTGYWYVFPNKGLHGGANELTEMLLYICPDDYELEGKDRPAYLDPITGKLYLNYNGDDSLLKVLYPDYDEKMTALCLESVQNVKKHAVKEANRFGNKGEYSVLQPYKSTV